MPRQPAVLLGKGQLLVGVGRVVGELPSKDPHQHGHILHSLWQRELAQQLEIVLHEVRILLLREVVMMGLVVLHIPGLGQHPVQPIQEAAETNGKDPALVVLGQGIWMILLQAVVASMRHVMSNDGPLHAPGIGDHESTHTAHQHCCHAPWHSRTCQQQAMTSIEEHLRNRNQTLQVPGILFGCLTDGCLGFLDVLYELFRLETGVKHVAFGLAHAGTQLGLRSFLSRNS
eukprot:Skav204601  [mRNA]  locus=scaffold672:241796:242889:+ [translate_table: standard]